MQEPVFLAITNLKDVEAVRFECKSWAWQLQQGVNKDELKPALRFVVKDEPENVLRCAAKSAFWSLQRAVLTDIAELQGYSLAGCTELFEVLFALVKQTLVIPDEEVMAILEKRGAALYRSQTGLTELLSVDEAAACLDEDDREGLQKTQDGAKAQALETDEFNKAWGKMYMRLHGGSPAAAKKAALVLYGGKKKIDAVLKAHMNQQQAKEFMPPMSYLWRCRTSNSWCSRFKDFPVRSASDSAWESEAGALIECLQHAWKWYLHCHTLPTAACPIKGLF